MFRFIINTFQRLLPDGLVGNPVRNKQRSLLRLLAVAYSEKLDPQILVGNLSVEYPDAYGRKLVRLEQWLAAGSSLSTALSHVPGVLDDKDALLIQCGIETGSVNEAFDLLLSSDPENDRTTTGNILRSTICYFVVMLVFATFVTTFLMVFIIPTLAQIFEEFALDLPLTMSALIDFSRSAAVIGPITLLVALGVAILLLSDDVRRFIDRSWLGRWLPTSRMRQTAGLLRLFALPTGQGNPIGPTLTAAASFHSDRRCRRRLLQARAESRSNSDAWNQLANQKLISKNQSEQIQLIDKTSLQAWALRTLADRTDERSCARIETIARLIENLPVILLGLLVGWIAIAMMQTLSGLVLSLS